MTFGFLDKSSLSSVSYQPMKLDLHRTASVIENSQLCINHYLLVLEDAELAKAVLPGQFINLKIRNREELLLRRPFSIARARPEQSSVEIVYQVVGKGTAAMRDLGPGERVDLLGPLGKGFHLPEKEENCLLIGGGCGVAPLWALADCLFQKGNTIIALLGFRSSSYVFGIDVFKAHQVETIVTTDDGSDGLKGFASEHAEEVLKRPIDRVYVCGPTPMLKAVIPMIRRAGRKGEVSVEEKMGCGYGVCLSCAVPVRKNGVLEKQRACKEGPVFDIEEVEPDDAT